MIQTPLDLQPPQSVEEATAAIAELTALAAAGKISLDASADLVNGLKAFIDARIGADTEVRLANIEQMLRERDIRPVLDNINVSGGLPDLPGTGILLPPRNPAAPNGHDSAPEDEPS